MPKKPPSSIFSRSQKLLAVTSQLARKEIGQRFKERISKTAVGSRVQTQIDQAKLLAESLSELKGAAMKTGQMLGIQAEDLLPPEVIEVLTKLQKDSEPMDYSVIEEVLKAELGEAFERLEGISTQSIASASIGQVHRATIDGKSVAIKIQYPGIADAIDSDLVILRKLVSVAMGMMRKKADFTGLFEELAFVLKAEADYRKERQNLDTYRENLQESENLIVPESFPEFSTERVLTMSFESGKTITEWIAGNPSAEDRQKVGEWILDLYCREFYEWGFVQTDPNYANFMIQENPLRVVLLDFGATLRYSLEFRKKYKSLIKTVETRDHDAILESAYRLGILDERESEEAKFHFVMMMENALEPFEARLQPFRFSDEDYSRRARQVVSKFVGALKFTPPPREIIFLHRKLGGVFQLLKKLDLEVDLAPFWDRALSYIDIES